MDPEKLGPLLQEYDLKLASGWFSGTLRECTVDEEWENLQEMLYTFKSLQAPVLVYAETSGSVQTKQQIPVSQRPVMPDEEYPEYGRKLTEIADRMADYGVPMVYHHHMGTVIETEREVDLEVMANTGPNVNLLIDTGHTFAGGNVEATTRRHGHRVKHVHCKDIRRCLQRVQAEHELPRCCFGGIFTVPGMAQSTFITLRKYSPTSTTVAGL